MRWPASSPEWLKEVVERMADNLESQISASGLDANAMFLFAGKTQLFRDLKNEIDAVAGQEEKSASQLKSGATDRARADN